MNVEFVALGVVSGLWAYFILQAFRRSAQLDRLTPAEGSSTNAASEVCVLVPARNEAEIIEASIRSVIEQGEVVKRVIVVDDQSQDDTPDILRRLEAEFPRLDLLQSTGPQPGQCGKPAALVHAYEKGAPETQWLLFLDADVVLSPGAIEAMLEWAKKHSVDLLSGFPEMILISPLEKLILPSMAVLIGRRYPSVKVADKESTCAFANGQLILIRKSVYDQIEGHRVVLNDILEDVRLAEHAKAAGYRLNLVDLSALARTRMYANWSQLSEGWIKNIYLLLGASPFVALSWCVLSILLGSSGVLLLVTCSYPWGALGFGVVTLSQMLIRYRLRFPWAWALLSSLGSILTAMILLRSTWKHTLGGNIKWKGRSYEANP